MRVTVVGYLSIDQIQCPAGSFDAIAGGAAGYCAAAAAWAGADVRLIARAGDDYPREALDGLARAGVDVSGVERIAGPSRRSRLHDPSGRERTLLHLDDRGWWEATRRLAPPVPAGHGVFVYTAMPPDVLRRQIEGRAPQDLLIGDTSMAYASAFPDDMLALAERLDVFAPSREETRRLLPGLDDDAALRQLARSIGLVVQKRGADGLALMRDGGAPLLQPSLAATVVDTTGAGDSVVGALAAGLARGLDDEEILRLSASAAARTVSAVGIGGLLAEGLM